MCLSNGFFKYRRPGSSVGRVSTPYTVVVSPLQRAWFDASLSIPFLVYHQAIDVYNKGIYNKANQ